MRSRIMIILALAMLGIAFIGCNDDDDKNENTNPVNSGETGGETGGEGTFSTTITGDLSMNLSLTLSTAVYCYSENWMTVTGDVTIDGTHYSLSIDIASTSTGTYDVKLVTDTQGNDAYATFIYINPDGKDMGNFGSTSGSVKVTQVEGSMKGTFTIKAQNILTGESITLSNGQFNLPSTNIEE